MPSSLQILLFYFLCYNKILREQALEILSGGYHLSQHVALILCMEYPYCLTPKYVCISGGSNPCSLGVRIKGEGLHHLAKCLVDPIITSYMPSSLQFLCFFFLCYNKIVREQAPEILCGRYHLSQHVALILCMEYPYCLTPKYVCLI